MILCQITIMDWIAIAGAAAWMPQIITWVCRFLTKPKITIYPHSKPEVGYTTYGPIFNIRLALLSENKDAILKKISVKLIHESGATYVFDWDGLSEDLGEINNPIAPPLSIKKTSLPLVIKILHTGVSQFFVRFQHGQFKMKFHDAIAIALDRYNLLKSSGKLKTDEDIENLVSEKEFNEIVRLLNSEFIWAAGKYKVEFVFESPGKFKYRNEELYFSLNQDDIDNLRKNIDNVKKEILQNAKAENIKDFKSDEIVWLWRNPELKKT